MWKPENDERQLIDKLRKIEALCARPGTDGERHVLEEHLEEVTRRVIDNALGGDDTSTDVRWGAAY